MRSSEGHAECYQRVCMEMSCDTPHILHDALHCEYVLTSTQCWHFGEDGTLTVSVEALRRGDASRCNLSNS